MTRVKSLIKLTNLNSENLNEKELKEVRAGEMCWCSCWYEACGGSSLIDNGWANNQLDISSPEDPPYDQKEWGIYPT